jgi:hypothetical protein
MGLLTNLLGFSPEQTQGLLGFAAGMAQTAGPSPFPTSGAQGWAAGLKGYQEGMQGARDRAQQKLLMELKLRELQGEADDHDQARKQKRAIEDAARASMLTPGQQALSLGGGPTVANAERIPEMKGGFDTEGFLNQVMAINPLQALELRKSMAKAGPKFDAGITWVTGPDGRPMAVRTADDGSIKQIDGLAPRDKLELANLGGKDLAYNPYGLQPGQEFQRTATPGDLLSAATQRRGQDITMRGQNMVDARSREQNALAASNKAPTEFQGKSAAFGLRATEADKILRELDGQYSAAGVNLKNALGGVWGVGGALGAGANSMLSDSSQRVDQAQRDFINAILRQESGAAIGAQEFDNAAKQYFPQPGDSAAVKTQKARARQLAIQGLQANAGKAALTAPAAGGGWSITKVE